MLRGDRLHHAPRRALAPRRFGVEAHRLAGRDRWRNRDAQGDRLARAAAAVRRPASGVAWHSRSGPPFRSRMSPSRCRRSQGRSSLLRSRFAAGLAGLVCGLALAALGQRLGIPARSVLLDSTWKTLEIYLLAGWFQPSPGRIICARGISTSRRLPLSHPGSFHPRLLEPVRRLDPSLAQTAHLRADRPQAAPARRWASWLSSRTSGLLHEYLFLPVDREVLGWQLGFFLLHGAGCDRRLGHRACLQTHVRSAASRAPWPLQRPWFFVLLTVPLFIHCLDRVIDLHRGLGAWVLRMRRTSIRSGRSLPDWAHCQTARAFPSRALPIRPRDQHRNFEPVAHPIDRLAQEQIANHAVPV